MSAPVPAVERLDQIAENFTDAPCDWFTRGADADVPDLISAVRAALNRHTPSHRIHGIRYCQTCNEPWPCNEIHDITEALTPARERERD